MPIEESQLPLFLGISHRAARRGYGWDLLGLTSLLLFPFFPQRLTGLQCVVGINRELLGLDQGLSYRLLLTDESQPTNQGWSDQNFSLVSSDAQTALPVKGERFAVPTLPPEGGTASFGWGFVGRKEQDIGIEIVAMPAPPLILWRPCRILVDIEINGNRYRRGEIVCGFAPPSPLTEEERRAIASRPAATKTVVFRLGCKLCGDEVAYFSQLNPFEERSAKVKNDANPLSEAPQNWSCRCGEQLIDLTYLKQGIHEVFRRDRPQSSSGDTIMEFTPLYEAGRMQDILAEYEHLIESSKDEETVQKYLEENPVFWAYLSPIRILHKPAVLTKKKADFGILTAQRVLYLVEIEKPSTKLTNQDGSISAEIQKGANQIRDWQIVVGDHRLTLLSELGLNEREVHEVRYLLIGGLARRTNVESLTKLRRTPFALNTEFFCFDELGSFLHTLSRELVRL